VSPGRSIPTLILLAGLPALLVACRQPVAASGDAAVRAAPPGEVCPPGGPPSFAELYRRVRLAVVNVSAAHALDLPAGLLSRRQQALLRAMVRSLGSGFVFDEQGHVVTCSSVVEDAESVEVILANGRRLPARLVGADEVTDLAVLQVDAALCPPPLQLGDSDQLRPGQWVAAFGYPYGLSHSITAGMVSAVRTAEQLQSAHGLIMSDLAVNPGCNGGPLLDTAGRVVGINLVPGRDGGGLGLALPGNDARRIIDLLVQGRTPRRPWLGVAVQFLDERLARTFGLAEPSGALVSRVTPGSPAERAGLRAGDVIVSFAGRPVTDPDALVEAVRQAAVGRRVNIGLLRAGRRRQLTIRPAVRP